MSGARGFSYALAPVLLTRTWELDALLLELGQCNEKLAGERQQLQELQARTQEVSQAWAEAASPGAEGFSVQGLELVTRFLGDLHAQTRVLEEAFAKTALERDGLIASVTKAQRALEAVEQHRDDMKAQFVRLRASGDFKAADDQWNTLQTRTHAHET
jgi:flagellar biosynthesis chaperone FliJ